MSLPARQLAHGATTTDTAVGASTSTFACMLHVDHVWKNNVIMETISKISSSMETKGTMKVRDTIR